MSYDVWLEDDDGEQLIECGNYTSNVAPMWRRALGRPLADFDGLRGSVAVERLGAAVQSMRAESESYRRLEAANGWGDYEGALDFLDTIARAALAHPDGVIRICR